MSDKYISDGSPGSDLFDPYETGWRKSISQATPTSSDQPCPKCNGEGYIVIRVYPWDGCSYDEKPCNLCNPGQDASEFDDEPMDKPDDASSEVIASLLPIPTRQQPNLHTYQEVSTQQTQNRINQHDLSSLPTRIMVVGYRYKVDLGPTVKPQVHLVDKQRRCSCELGVTCPAIEAVAEYLRNGGKCAPDPLPLCPICGAETFHDRDWDNKYTQEFGWRCTVGGLTHFLQAKTEKIKEAFRRKYAAVSEHENIAGR
jgi:hypothetical protein